MKKHILGAAVICVVLSILAFGLALRKSSANSQTEMQVQNKPDNHARSIKELAKLHGSYVTTASPHGVKKYTNISTLVRGSAVVITGIAFAKNSQLISSSTGNFILTDYQISVQSVLKGSLQVGETITVRTPGGRVQFEDGTSAEVKIPDFWKAPETSRTYVFFLRRKSDSQFALLGGPQGLFEISSRLTIEPQARDQDELKQRYKGTDVTSFLDEIRQNVEQEN